MRIGSFVSPKRPLTAHNFPTNFKYHEILRISKINGDKIQVVLTNGLPIKDSNGWFNVNSFEIIPFFKKGTIVKTKNDDEYTSLPSSLTRGKLPNGSGFYDIQFEVLKQNKDEVFIQETGKPNPIKMWTSYKNICLIKKNKWPDFL